MITSVEFSISEKGILHYKANGKPHRAWFEKVVTRTTDDFIPPELNNFIDKNQPDLHRLNKLIDDKNEWWKRHV